MVDRPEPRLRIRAPRDEEIATLIDPLVKQVHDSLMSPDQVANLGSWLADTVARAFAELSVAIASVGASQELCDWEGNEKPCDTIHTPKGLTYKRCHHSPPHCYDARGEPLRPCP